MDWIEKCTPVFPGQMTKFILPTVRAGISENKKGLLQ